MRSPNLARWSYNESLEGLLFFAQLVQELLFDYSLDSYKLPTHNLHSLSIEIKSIIGWIKTGNIKESTLDSELREFEYLYNNDPVANQIFSDNLIEKINKNRNDIKALDRLFNYIEKVLEGEYLIRLVKMLSEIIKEKQKKDILRKLVISYINELINTGYSKQYIYFQNDYLFFGNSTIRISTPDQIEEFFKIFDFKTRKFNIYVQVSNNFKVLEKELALLKIKLITSIPGELKDIPKVKEYFESHANPDCYLFFDEIEAFDSNAARENISDFINSFLITLCKSFVHKENFYFSENMLIYDSNTKHYFSISDPISSILKIEDLTIDALPRRFRTLIDKDLFIVRNTQLLRSLDFHLASLDTRNKENQLVNFWSALELLVSGQKKNSIIQCVLNTYVPLITFRYTFSLINNLRKDVENCCGEDIIKIINSSHGINLFQKCVALLSLKEYEPNLDQIFRLLDRNPLLRYKMFWLKKSLSDSSNMIKLLTKHQTRVKWQLERIYRARNLVVHTGVKPLKIDNLIENIHSYFDTTLNTLYLVSKKRKSINEISDIFIHVDLCQERYMNYLKSVKSICDKSNYLKIIFGEEFL